MPDAIKMSNFVEYQSFSTYVVFGEFRLNMYMYMNVNFLWANCGCFVVLYICAFLIFALK